MNAFKITFDNPSTIRHLFALVSEFTTEIDFVVHHLGAAFDYEFIHSDQSSKSFAIQMYIPSYAMEWFYSRGTTVIRINTILLYSAIKNSTARTERISLEYDETKNPNILMVTSDGKISVRSQVRLSEIPEHEKMTQPVQRKTHFNQFGDCGGVSIHGSLHCISNFLFNALNHNDDTSTTVQAFISKTQNSLGFTLKSAGLLDDELDVNFSVENSEKIGIFDLRNMLKVFENIKFSGVSLYFDKQNKRVDFQLGLGNPNACLVMRLYGE